MNTSLAEQGRVQKVWSDTKSNIPGNSTNKDNYPKGTKQGEAMKYLKGKLLPPH